MLLSSHMSYGTNLLFIALVFGLIEVMVEFHTVGSTFLIEESKLFDEALM